jgi:hypothetical protein
VSKTTLTDTEQVDKTSSEAIKKTDYEKVRDNVANANDTMKKGRERKSEVIANAVADKHLHKTAFSWIMKLRNMDPVQRNELLFHFDVYCDYEEFARVDLLADRPAPTARIVKPVKDANGVPRETDEDGESDPRPTHLRRPNASAAEAVDKIKNDALNQVGRGKPDASKPH